MKRPRSQATTQRLMGVVVMRWTIKKNTRPPLCKYFIFKMQNHRFYGYFVIFVLTRWCSFRFTLTYNLQNRWANQFNKGNNSDCMKEQTTVKHQFGLFIYFKKNNKHLLRLLVNYSFIITNQCTEAWRWSLTFLSHPQRPHGIDLREQL